MPEYVFKTKPFAHQEELFLRTRDTARYGLFWEQRCGKTKPTLDTAAYLYEKGEITGLFVIAPNGVHRNWVADEIPTHLPPRVAVACFIYESGAAGTKRGTNAAAGFLDNSSRELKVLVMSYDGFMTKKGKAMALAFLAKHRCLYVLDEAHRIKNPGAKRTKAILVSGKNAPYRRVLTGTPIANSPFDAYTIMKFLDLGFWKPFYLDSFFIFKNHFGIWRKVDPDDPNPYGAQYCVAHRNLEQLATILASCSSRVTKDKVLDLPPKVYAKRYFELNTEQKRTYREIRDEFMTYLNDGLVTAPLVIQRLIRLQQITSGWLPVEGEPAIPLGESNPRLAALEELLEDEGLGKVIIFAKFRRDVDAIMELTKRLGLSPVRYDGAINDPQQRYANLQAFQTGDARAFVANPAVAGEGISLVAATAVIYYNNSYKLTERLQSEDRAHGPGQTKSVGYVDIVAQDTVDEDIVDALVKKLDTASLVLGDAIKEWLR